MVTAADLRSHLRWGNPEGVLLQLEALSDAERGTLVEEFVSEARAIADGRSGEVGPSWDGVHWSGHVHAAEAVLYCTIERALADVPRDPDFIVRSLPRLFPKDLGRILAAWAERFLEQPRNHERVDAIAHALRWLEGADVRVPVNQATTLLCLTGEQSGMRLLSWVATNESFAHALVRSAFHVPGVPGATLESRDQRMLHADSVGGFVIPALIHIGILKQAEVLEWCDHAIGMEERTNFDKAWFKRLRSYLQRTEIATLPDLSGRWWLEPRARLVAAYRDVQAGVPRPEVAEDAELHRLMTLAAFLEQTSSGGLMMGVGDLCLAGEYETIDGARAALAHVGMADVAALLDRAVMRWKTHHQPALECDEWPGDDVRLVDQELDEEWLELSDKVRGVLG